MIYREFHLHAAPSMAQDGMWDLEAANAADPAAPSFHATVVPVFTRDLLNQLRGTNGYPNPGLIRAAGAAAWASLLPPPLDGALRESLRSARDQNEGLRLRLTAAGHALEGLSAVVQPTELPVEVLFDGVLSYLAHSPRTLLSRRLGSEPDVPAFRTALPLRMLVVTAMPNDLPDPGIEAERIALEEALRPATTQGALVLDFCSKATPSRLRQTLVDRPYHIVHFIGHGGFAPAALGGEPLGYFCLENPTDGSTSALDSETLHALLLSTVVRLVVLTACSTAIGSGLPLAPYPPAAFAGMAQRLLSGASLVSAVVAMQFDLEQQAAPLFSRAFYEALLLQNSPVDEAVRTARVAITVEMQVGHRAWITPALFVRCEGARVFDVPRLVAELSPQVVAELAELERLSNTYEGTLASLAQSSAAVRADPAIENLRKTTQESLNDILNRRAELLGDTLRLLGDSASRGKELTCTLVLRLRTTARIEFLSVSFACAEDSFRLVRVDPSPSAPGAAVEGTQKPAQLTLTSTDVSGGNVLQPGEYVLANIVLQITDAARLGLTALKSPGATVIRDGAQSALQVLAAALIVEST